MSRQADALRLFFDAHGIKQRDVAERLGLHEGTVSSILSGRYGISKETAAKMAQVFGFNIMFLMTGEGELESNGEQLRFRKAPPSSDSEALRAENAELRQQLEMKTKENDRLLGIIETLSKK